MRSKLKNGWKEILLMTLSAFALTVIWLITDYWRSLPPSFRVYEEFDANSFITLTNET